MLHLTPQDNPEEGTIIIPILQMRKWRYREGKQCARDHTASKWLALNAKPGRPASEPTLEGAGTNWSLNRSEAHQEGKEHIEGQCPCLRGPAY